MKELNGVVKFRRPDASRLRATALDFNGKAGKTAGNASELNLVPNTIYYLIEK